MSRPRAYGADAACVIDWGDGSRDDLHRRPGPVRALRDPRVTSAVIGASPVEQLDTNLGALDHPPLTEQELAAIDQFAVDSGVNLWAKQTED